MFLNSVNSQKCLKILYSATASTLHDFATGLVQWEYEGETPTILVEILKGGIFPWYWTEANTRQNEVRL